MKKLILSFFRIWYVVLLKAQSSFNYQEYGLLVCVGLSHPYTDVRKENSSPTFQFAVNYNYNPYVPIALEFQWGSLSGGGRTVDQDSFRRQYKNHFKTQVLHADLQVGDIIDYSRSTLLNILKNFYAGTGIGLIFNKMADIQRTILIIANGLLDYTFPGKEKSVNLILPLRLSYEFKLYDNYDRPATRITFGYQHNLTFNEGLDGYNDDLAIFTNRGKDGYNLYTIGVKFDFGHTTSYKSQSGILINIKKRP